MQPMSQSLTALEGRGFNRTEPVGAAGLDSAPAAQPSPWAGTGPSASQVRPLYVALASYDKGNRTKCLVREPLRVIPSPIPTAGWR